MARQLELERRRVGAILRCGVFFTEGFSIRGALEAVKSDPKMV